MATKIQITITPDSENLSPERMNDAMARTIRLLAAEAGVPTRKLTLTIECKDEESEDHEDAIDAALSGRPVGIEVVMKTTKERHVARVSRDTSRPMDSFQGFADKHHVSVSGSLFGQRIDVAPTSDIPVSSDAPPH
jgi:hypothetical protein